MPILNTHARTAGPTKNELFQPMGRSVALFGVFVGFVKRADDVQRNGRLMVWIPEFGSAPDDENGWISVNYCSPFAGATNVNTTSQSNLQQFEGTQTSYGMWFVPPDVNNQVIVMFLNGDPIKGIWIGSLFQQYMNNMVPGMAADVKNWQYPGKEIPIAEYNKWDQTIIYPDRTFKPYEKTKFKGVGNQGLIVDKARGTTTSGARRESPSQVFGIITPGPAIDSSVDPANIRRKGGSSFIMDDGTSTEYIQLTTKSGAQIKLDETNGFVYLINRDGTAWVQMDQKGNVDIFGATNISMRAQRDFNIRADRNVNIEAGQNIFMKAAKDTEETTTAFTYDVNNVPKPLTIPVWKYVGEGKGQGGNIVMQALNNWQSTTQKNAFITVIDNNMDIKIGNSLLVTTQRGGQDYNSKQGIKLTSDAAIDIAASGNIRVGSNGSISIVGMKDIVMCTSSSMNIKAANNIQIAAVNDVLIAATNLGVTAEALFSNTVGIDGNTNIGGNTSIVGGATVGGVTNLVGDTNIGGNTNINGNTNTGGNANVAGDSSVSGTLDCASDVNVTGNITTNGDIITGGNLSVSGSLNAGGSVGLTGELRLSGNIECSGSGTFGGMLSASGAVIGGSLSVGGDGIFGGSLTSANQAGTVTVDETGLVTVTPPPPPPVPVTPQTPVAPPPPPPPPPPGPVGQPGPPPGPTAPPPPAVPLEANPAQSEGARSASTARPAEVKPLNQKLNILATWDDPDSKFKRKSQSLQTTVSKFPTYEPCPEHESFNLTAVTGYAPIVTPDDATYRGSNGAGNVVTAPPPAAVNSGANNTSVHGDSPSDTSVTKDVNMNAFRCQLIIHEGLVNKSYVDRNGVSGGIGHLMRANEVNLYPVGTPISDTQIETWYVQDSSSAITIAQELIGDAWGSLSDIRKRACADLAYNLGKGGLSKFTKFLAAIKKLDFETAGQELTNSAWFSQVGKRGPNIITMIVKNTDPNGCDKRFPT